MPARDPQAELKHPTRSSRQFGRIRGTWSAQEWPANCRSSTYAARGVPPTSYIYELRECETVVATGHITHDPPLEVGQRLVINQRDGLVHAIDATTDPREQRLVIQLLRNDQ